jgi:hypothetical protein
MAASISPDRTILESPSFTDITIQPIALWDNHDTCQYCASSGVYADSAYVLVMTGRLSGRELTIGQCRRHALEALLYTQYESLEAASAACYTPDYEPDPAYPVELRRDGRIVRRFQDIDSALSHLHQIQSSSYSHAIAHEGYSLTRLSVPVHIQ